MTKKLVNRMCLCLLILAIIIAGVNSYVYAADEQYTCKLELIPDKLEILAGETVTIEIRISDIQAGNGIVILDGLLEYDDTAFEETFKIQTDDDEKWEKSVQENYMMFLKADREATIEDQVIGKIVLTAKEDVELGFKEVQVLDIIVSSDDGKKFSVDDISTEIEIVDEHWEDEPGGDNSETGNQGGDNSGSENQGGDNSGSGNQGGDNSGTGNQGGDNSGSGSQGNGTQTGGSTTQTPAQSVNTGKADTTLPKTGNINFLAIGIVGAIILMSIFYIKYRRAY